MHSLSEVSVSLRRCTTCPLRPPMPRCSFGAVRGVNPLDNNLLGRLTAASSYPFVVGIDFAGVVERVPAGALDLRAGDRVFGMARTHGSYADYTAVAPTAAMEPLARIPDGVPDDQAAALPIPAASAADRRSARRQRRSARRGDGRNWRGGW